MHQNRGLHARMCATSRVAGRRGGTLPRMATQPLSGEQPGKLEALLDRWQVSLDLHARYAALDDARYWHVQPWPKHERPQRWIIQLARKRILALKRVVAQRQSEGDRAFIEGIEIMCFLATLVGLTSVDRFIPLATPETERRDVLAAKPAPQAPRATAESARSRVPPNSIRPTPGRGSCSLWRRRIGRGSQRAHSVGRALRLSNGSPVACGPLPTGIRSAPPRAHSTPAPA